MVYRQIIRRVQSGGRMGHALQDHVPCESGAVEYERGTRAMT